VHTNEKNFVGLAVNSEYIACGSETNEVFVYHKVCTTQLSDFTRFAILSDPFLNVEILNLCRRFCFLDYFSHGSDAPFTGNVSTIFLSQVFLEC